MAGMFDDLLPGATPTATGSGLFDDLLPKAPAPVAPPKEPGMLRSLADTGLSLARGAVQGAKMLTDVAGAGNQASETLAGGVKWLSENFSDYSKWEQLTSAQDMKAAELSGSTWEEVKAAARAFSKRPVDFLAEAAGTSIPTIAAAFLPGGQGALLGRVAMLGMGAAQGTGAVKGQIYDTVEEAWTKAGATPQEAKERADAAQSYFGSNAGQIALGAALGGLAGRTGLESAIAGKAAPKGMLAKVPGVARGALAEGIPEAAQGGQEQLAGNLALQNEGFNQPTWAGVTGNAALEALAGGAVGAVSAPFAKELPAAPAPAPRPTPEQAAASVLAAGSVDEAINAMHTAVAAGRSTPQDEAAKRAARSEIVQLDPEEQQEAMGLLNTATSAAAPGNVRRYAQNRLDALLKDVRQVPVGEATETTPEQVVEELRARAQSLIDSQFSVRDAIPMEAAQERQALAAERGIALNIIPHPAGGFALIPRTWAQAAGLERDALPVAEATESEIIPTPETFDAEPIPAGDAAEVLPTPEVSEAESIPTADVVEDIPTPEAYEQAPVGEATELIPAGDATELPKAIPKGKATELEVETILADDLLTSDGMPYGSKTAANVRAKREGLGPANVVEIPNAGWVVRPQPKTLGAPGVEARPAGTRGTDARDVVKAPERGVMPSGLRVTFGGKTYPVESITDAQEKWVRFQESADGGMAAGVSQIGNGVPIIDGAGRLVARVAYNGRVFGPNDEVLAEAPGRTAMPPGVRKGTAEKYLPPRETLEQARERSERQAQDVLKKRSAIDGTNPARAPGQRPADGGRGDGAGVLPVVQPGDVAAGASAPAGQGVAGGGAAGPGKRDGALSEPWKLTREQAAKDYPGDEYDRMLNRHGDIGDLSYVEVDRRARINALGQRKLWAKTRAQLEQEGKDAVRAARGERAAVNKLKSTPEFANWRLRAMSAKGKQAIADAERLAREYLSIHKDRVQEALMEGKDVPAEVLADYPDLKRPDAAPPPAKQGPTTQGESDGQEELQGQGQGQEVAPAAARVAASAPVAALPQSDDAVSNAEPMKRLGLTMRRAGWEIDYIDLDLTAEQPKADIRISREDGRFIIAKVDAQGRATMETFQRTRSLGIDQKNKQARLAPQIDDQFLGRQKFEGARSMLRGMVNYLTDNATNPVALSDMKAAWAGVMAGPTDAAPALPAPTLADKIKQRRAEKAKQKESEGIPLQAAMRMTYAQAVAENMRHMGTEASEWSAVEVTGSEMADTPAGKRSVPTFSMPSGYKSAPTLFPSSATQMNCELCGTPIKFSYWIQNDSKRWTLMVGSECVTHFGEGKSGERLTKEAQQKIDRDLLGAAQQAKAGLIKHYRQRVSRGYGRYDYEFPSYGDGLRAGDLNNKLKKLIGDRMNAYKVASWDYEPSGDAAVTRWANKNRDEASELIRQARLLIEKKEGKAAASAETAAPNPAAERGDQSPAVEPEVEQATPTPASARRTEARGQAKHPRTVMGSRILALVSQSLGGLDPAWIAEFSHRQETAAKDKNGRPRIQWRNPLIPGVGRLFRRGGTQDLQLLAELMEGAGYLPPGSVEADAKEAGETAKQMVRDALNRAEAQTMEERQAEAQAAEDADRDAFYAALDAESAAEAEAERQAIMAESAMDPRRVDAAADDDIPFLPGEGKAASTAETMRFLGFTEQEIADAERQEREALQPGRDGGAAGQDAAQAARTVPEARGAAAQPADQAKGLKRPPVAEGDRIRFTGKDGAIVEGVAVQVLDTSGGNYRIKIRTDEPAPQGGGNINRTVYSQDGKFVPLDELLTAQTAEDLQAKTEREAEAAAAERRTKTAEQERLRREAEQRDIRARADQTVDDFQLGQSADRQMSGMDDMFGDAPPTATEPRARDEQTIELRKRLSVLKSLKECIG